jgi:voltage-gated potassium channel
MLQQLRQRIYQVFYAPDPADPITLVDNYFVPLLIAIDVAALLLESFDALGQQYANAFRFAERVVVGLFTLEYGLRLWSAVEDPRYAEPLRGRLRYMGTSFALVDLVAFLPFLALNLLPLDWAAIAGPFFRLLRLLKLIRYSESTRIFFRVLRDKRDELLTTLFVVMTLLVITSSLMYFIEREAQPQAFSSIPAAMWWGVITLTTVGYGDVYPITPLGKLLSSMLAFLGIGIFALPAWDLAMAFSEEMRAKKMQVRGNGDRRGVSPFRLTADAAAEVEAAADLMQLCVAAAQRKLGGEFEHEDVVRDLAIALFQETSSILRHDSPPLQNLPPSQTSEPVPEAMPQPTCPNREMEP